MSRHRPPQFTIVGLLLAMTAVGACLALLRYIPCVGVPALLVCVPALVFAMAVGRAYRNDGRPLTPGDRLELSIMALAISALALVIGGTVFFAIASVGMVIFEFVGPVAGVPVAVIAVALGIASFGWTLWRFIHLVRVAP